MISAWPRQATVVWDCAPAAEHFEYRSMQ